MFEVSVSMNFSAAHNLRGYQGKCEALHGHNWKVEVVLRAARLDKIGMVEDFTFIKGKRILQGKLDDRIPGFDAIRHAGGISEINDVLMRQEPEELFNDGQAADA